MEAQEKDVWFAKVRPCVKNAMGREIIANAVERANALIAKAHVQRIAPSAMARRGVGSVTEIKCMATADVQLVTALGNARNVTTKALLDVPDVAGLAAVLVETANV